ncbi:MAG: NOP58 family protein [Candidatus Micrarchaeota archaeon]|nr:NOP58 family protein [Candidatus Micrarchaeota archaeon]
MSNAYSVGDHAVMQGIASYNELEKTRNLIHEKLEEWYGIYFPELRLSNQLSYARFVMEFGANKKDATKERLDEVLGGNGESVLNSINRSIGKEPSEQEYQMLRGLAEQELSMAKELESLDKYLEKSVKELMPNISYLVEYKIAAELLGKAGSLQKLSIMPSGTIQLLGAEKALFKHIKFGSKPPKYGVLYKLPQIGTAGRGVRGKIARVYATKIAIAARADAITKNFIAEGLKAQLDKAIERINSAPVKYKKEESRDDRSFKGNRNFRGRNRGYRGRR